MTEPGNFEYDPVGRESREINTHILQSVGLVGAGAAAHYLEAKTGFVAGKEIGTAGMIYGANIIINNMTDRLKRDIDEHAVFLGHNAHSFRLGTTETIKKTYTAALAGVGIAELGNTLYDHNLALNGLSRPITAIGIGFAFICTAIAARDRGYVVRHLKNARGGEL